MISRGFTSVFALGLAVAAAPSIRPSDDLFAGFTAGWRDAWTERAMARRPNTFRLENENDNRFLRVDSRSSASVLWRRVDLEVTPGTAISWRWRVAMSLGHLDDERQRTNDDYAARVVVMFDSEPFAHSTPLLMYV